MPTDTQTAVFCLVALETAPQDYVLFAFYKQPVSPEDHNRGAQP